MATDKFYTYLHTLSLHYARPIYRSSSASRGLSAPSLPPVSCSCACRARIARRLDVTASRALAGRASTPPSSQLRSRRGPSVRSEEHTSELQSLMRISYDVFCLKKKQYRQHTSQMQRTTNR